PLRSDPRGASRHGSKRSRRQDGGGPRWTALIATRVKEMVMTTERYEILILGSGAGGTLLAWHMAGAGHRTAVVERRWIGGSCPNVNCLPSKNEIWSAKVADLVRRAADFGMVTGPYKIDMRRVRQRKRDMVEAEIAAHLENYEASGAELIMGAGRFVA